MIHVNIYKYIIFPVVSVLSLLLFASLWRYVESLQILLDNASVIDTFDPEILRTQKNLLVNKLWRVRIYFLLIMIISITLITSGATGYGFLAMDCTVLCLVTLMMYFGQPPAYKFESVRNVSFIILRMLHVKYVEDLQVILMLYP